MNELFECEIPFRIVPKARPQVTRRGTYTPSSKAERDLILYLQAEFRKEMKFDAFLRAHMSLLLGRCQGRRGDIDNILKTALDALVLAGVLAGDDMQHLRGATVVLVEDRDTTLRVWADDEKK